MKTLTQKFAGIGLGICFLIANYVNAQTLTANGTCNSVPINGTLKPIQVLMDNNNLSGFGMGNAEDPNLAPFGPTKYFIAGRGTAPALFAPVINWVNRYRADVSIGCRRAVKIDDNYFVLYHEYDPLSPSRPTGARISRLNLNTGAIISSVKLDLSGSGLSDIYAWDMVSDGNSLFVLCRGNNGTDDTPIVSIVDASSLLVIDNILLPFTSTYLADGLTRDNSGNLNVIGRVNSISGSGTYNQIVISKLLATNPLQLIDQKLYDIGNDNIIHSAIKNNPFTNNLVVACQTIDVMFLNGSLHLWNLDASNLNFINFETYSTNNRLFNSNINIDSKRITLAGPNNNNVLANGNVVALFNHDCSSDIAYEFPFTGSFSEEHIIAGSTAANYFIMASELLSANLNKVSYAVNLKYSTPCNITPVKMISQPVNVPIFGTFAFSSNFSGSSSPSILGSKIDKFISTDACNIRGRAASSGSFTEIIDNNQELNWNFKQAQEQISLTATTIISDLKVVNLQGQVFNFSSNDTEVNFNTERLFPGIYVASFMIDGELKTKKFIVNR